MYVGVLLPRNGLARLVTFLRVHLIRTVAKYGVESTNQHALGKGLRKTRLQYCCVISPRRRQHGTPSQVIRRENRQDFSGAECRSVGQTASLLQEEFTI